MKEGEYVTTHNLGLFNVNVPDSFVISQTNNDDVDNSLMFEYKADDVTASILLWERTYCEFIKNPIEYERNVKNNLSANQQIVAIKVVDNGRFKTNITKINKCGQYTYHFVIELIMIKGMLVVFGTAASDKNNDLEDFCWNVINEIRELNKKG